MLLPARFQNTDDMPMSLGKAIALEIAPRKSDPIEAFNKGQHSQIAFNSATKTCLLTPISEKDCRQIKGAAKGSSPSKGPTAEKVGTSRPLPEAAPPVAQKFKVGDRVRAIASFENWHAVGDTGVVLEVDDGVIVVRFDPSETTSAGLLEFGTACYSERLELIQSPAPEPAATPVAPGVWIEWRGGKCPVPAGTLIDTMHRIAYCGKKEWFSVKALEENSTGTDAAHANLWSNDDHMSDIIAYRVLA